MTADELQTIDTALNQELYRALVECRGEVRVTHPGERRQVRYTPNHAPRQGLRAIPTCHGEQYGVDCPCCGDTRGRCLVSHRLGIRDPKTGSTNWHLFHCYNESCHQDRDSWQRMRHLLSDAGYHPGSARLRRTTSTSTVIKQSSDSALLPADVVPLLQLPTDHPASAYLSNRGFNPEELSIRWNLQYCKNNKEAAPHFEDSRILIPIYAPAPHVGQTGDSNNVEHFRKLVGWQARSIEPARRKRKYLFMDGFQKGSYLYGLLEAQAASGPVILCEGVTDCWAIGPGAVAIFGKTLSPRQESLLTQHFLGRQIVVMLDRDAQHEAHEIQRRLRSHISESVVIADLPEGHDDPGDCPRRQLNQSIARALDCKPTQLRRRQPFDVVGARQQLNKRGIRQLGELIAVGYSLERGLAFAGEDRRLRYITNNPQRFLAKIEGCKRIYYDATQALLTAGKSSPPKPEHFEDLKSIGRLLDENMPSGLDNLAQRLLGPGNTSTLAMVATSAEPNALDTLNTTQAIRHVWDEANPLARLQDEGLEFVYEQIEKPIVAATASMMRTGVRIDVDLLESRLKQYHQSNDSGLQFAEQLHRHLDTESGRVHCRLDPLGTATGRFACRDPALQSTPAKMKDVFVPDPGCVLIEADFSQIELRVLAQITQDPSLLQAFQDNQDLHKQTAGLVLGIAPKAVSPSQRQLGKQVNFAIIYGRTAAGLARDLNMSESQAEQLLRHYFEKYPRVKRWISQIHRQVRRDGFVTTLYGRRRRLPDACSSDNIASERALRQAVNAVIQGTAADINKLALARLWQSLPGDCQLLLTVHDSVLLQAPAEKAETMAKRVRRIMQKAPPKIEVPLVIKVGQGNTWGDCNC